MMIWNRKEVFVGNSLQAFNEVRSMLTFNRVKYDYKVVDSTSTSFFGPSNRARMGTYGVNMDYAKTYYIYVHKNDYDQAKELIG